MALPVGAIIGAGKIISGIFGGGESLEEEHARWMAGWKREMTATQWAYFNLWIQTRDQKQDWYEICPVVTASELEWTRSRPTFPWPFIQRKANDILGKSPNCRPDWRQTGGMDMQEIVDDQANANLPPESQVSIAGIGGMLPLLIAGGVLVALMFSKTR